MNPAPRHEIPEGFTLIEGDRDLFGHVTFYLIEGTPYAAVRTPSGWRARLAPHGNARRVTFGPSYADARQVVRYLMKHRGLSLRDLRL